MKFSVRKQELWGTRWWRNRGGSFLRFGTIPARGGQMDGHVAVAKICASI